MGKIAVIIVAAGTSSRMKEPKQLLPFRNTTLLGNAIEQATGSVADEVVVVLGANYEKIKARHSFFDVRIVEHRSWEKGIGTSIATGIKDVIDKDNFEAVLIMLGDQPFIDSSYLDQMIARFRIDPAKIIATKYPKSNGVPAIFSREYFNELSGLQGDIGAKYLLNANENAVLSLSSENKIIDIDTPEDYQQLRKQNI